ncbi:hypothetical protein BCR33DRAFT_719293, partial [Rhizoclosmatium globosum]
MEVVSGLLLSASTGSLCIQLFQSSKRKFIGLWIGRVFGVGLLIGVLGQVALALALYLSFFEASLSSVPATISLCLAYLSSLLLVLSLLFHFMDHLSMLSPSSTIPSLFDRIQYYLASFLVIDCFASFLGFVVGSQWLVYLWPITVTLLLPTLPLLSYPHTSSKTLQIYTLNESFLPVRNTYTRSSIALALTPFALILLALVSSYTLGLNAVITLCLTGIAALARISEYYMKAWTDVVALLFANPGVKEGVVGGKRGIQGEEFLVNMEPKRKASSWFQKVTIVTVKETMKRMSMIVFGYCMMTMQLYQS